MTAQIHPGSCPRTWRIVLGTHPGFKIVTLYVDSKSLIDRLERKFNWRDATYTLAWDDEDIAQEWCRTLKNLTLLKTVVRDC